MEIRKANESDINAIQSIYENARKYMAENGNPTQWDNGYPDESVIRKDISQGNSHVLVSNGEVLGVFVFIIGEESTYQIIENGAWHFDQTYGTIHRIASSGKVRGFAKLCFDNCLTKIDYLRIDTHQNNRSMRHAIESYGFKECGIIHVRNGERIAFDYLKQEG